MAGREAYSWYRERNDIGGLPLGAAFGLGAWVFCIWTGVHCMLTDGGAIVIVSLLLGCVGIAVGIVYLIIWFFMGLFV